MSSRKINCSKFYQTWKGHPIEDLETFRDITTQTRGDKPIVYLAGDSSLDNKAWVLSSGPGGDPLPVPVPNIYNDTLDKPHCKPDIAFWMNHFLGETGTCINTSVEESMLRERDQEILPWDAFIRDNIRSQDYLIVSIGANDIALKPNTCTMFNMARLAWATRKVNIENGSAGGLPYFRQLFGRHVKEYLEHVLARQKPRAVILCMIYYPLEGTEQVSWADTNLKLLGYNKWPDQLQAAIKQIYESATKEVAVEGTQIIPCPLFELLNGKRKEEYAERVEPSSEGGRKMAEKFVQMINEL